MEIESAEICTSNIAKKTPKLRTNMEHTTVGVNLTLTESFNKSGNESSEMNERVMTEMSRISVIVGLALTILWTVLIVTLNLAVIITITRYPTRSRLYFFLFHLALADFMAGIIHCLPHSIERIIGFKYGEATWLAGEFLCKLRWTFGDAAVMTSNYVLACMSMDRAFAVCQPMKRINYRGVRAQRVAIACCWLFSIAVYTPYLKFVRLIPGHESKRPSCIPKYPSDEDYKTELILKFTFLFCLPFTIIVISYGLLLTTVIRRSSGSFHGSNNPDHQTAQIFNGRIPKSKLKSIKLTLGIVISFIFCWSAHFTEYFVGIFGNIRHPIFIVLTTFYYLNSVANPILFFIYHKKKTNLSAKSSYSSYGRSKVDNSLKAIN